MKLIIAILIGALLFFLQRYFYQKLWQEDLDVDISFPAHTVYEGEQSHLIETIVNRKWLPLPVLQVKFAITRTFLFAGHENSTVTDQYYRTEYFSLKPYEKITRDYTFVCSRRGLFGMRDMDVICMDLMLSSEMIATLKHKALITVLPRRIPVSDIPFNVQKLMGEVELNLKIQEDPFAFATIREYQPYDMMHSVNWKMSARMDKLMVNTYHTTLQKELVILLNLTCNSSLHNDAIQEEVFRIGVSLAEYYISKRIPVALCCNGRDSVSEKTVDIMQGADKAHLRTIEVALARVDLNKKVYDFAELMKEKVNDPENAEYLVVSNCRKKELLDVYSDLKDRYKNMTLIVPTLRMEEEPEIGIRWEIGDE